MIEQLAAAEARLGQINERLMDPAVVVEHAGSGNGIAPVARAMLDAYFSGKQSDADAPIPEMSLLG